MRVTFLLCLILSCTISYAADPFAGKKIIDLTYSFGKDTIYWPTGGGVLQT